MRSPRAEPARRLARIGLALALALAGATGAGAQDAAEAPAMSASASATPPPAASAPAGDPRAARIEAAVDRLRADPLLSGKHIEHRLRWKDLFKPERKRKTPEDGSALEWLATFVRFLNDTSRFLLWGGVAVLVALALVSARHVVQLRAFHRRVGAAAAVSHVRELDVRPESLPDDVGAAAWALWQAGRVPDALSRLIHRFQVPIPGSATEGECLALAGARLPAPALRYVTQVVRAREARLYGDRTLSLAMGEALCAGFGTRLDAATATAATPEDAA